MGVFLKNELPHKEMWPVGNGADQIAIEAQVVPNSMVDRGQVLSQGEIKLICSDERDELWSER